MFCYVDYQTLFLDPAQIAIKASAKLLNPYGFDPVAVLFDSMAYPYAKV